MGRLPASVHLRVVHPERLTGAGVDGRHLIHGGRQIQHTVDHERCRLEAPNRDPLPLLAQRLEIERTVGRRPAPRDTEFVEVGGIDLVQRRILRAAVVTAIVAPLTVGRAVLGTGRQWQAGDGGGQEDDDC